MSPWSLNLAFLTQQYTATEWRPDGPLAPTLCTALTSGVRVGILLCDTILPLTKAPTEPCIHSRGSTVPSKQTVNCLSASLRGKMKEAVGGNSCLPSVHPVLSHLNTTFLSLPYALRWSARTMACQTSHAVMQVKT